MLDGISRLYETQPFGVQDQPPFLNLAVRGLTDLTPRELLTALKRIETDIGRRPTFRWGPRVVDIDILLYGQERIETDLLTVPHASMVDRAFVLVPLAEIAPQVLHPVLGRTVVDLADSVPGRDTIRPLGSVDLPGRMR